jgi:hypothetical protein
MILFYIYEKKTFTFHINYDILINQNNENFKSYIKEIKLTTHFAYIFYLIFLTPNHEYGVYLLCCIAESYKFYFILIKFCL